MGVISSFPSPYDSDVTVGMVDLELVSLLWRRTGFIVKFAMLQLGVLLSSCCLAFAASLLRNEFSCLCRWLEFRVVNLGVLVRLLSSCRANSETVALWATGWLWTIMETARFLSFVVGFDYSTLLAAVDSDITILGVCSIFDSSRLLPCGVLVRFAFRKSATTISTSSGVSNSGFLGVRVWVTCSWVQLW